MPQDSERVRDLELERQILGVILAYSTAPEGSDRVAIGPFAFDWGLRPDDFSHPVHADIWKICASLLEERIDVDAVTVHTRAVSVGRLTDRDVFGIIQAWRGSARPSAAGITLMLDGLRSLAVKRRALYELGQLKEDLTNPDTTVEDIRDRLSTVDTWIAQRAGARWMDASRQRAATVEYVNRDTRFNMKLGLPAIDDQLEMGISPGEVVEVMAKSGTGKTVLVANTVNALTDQPQWGVVMFSLEMPGPQIVSRVQQVAHGISRRELYAQIERDEYDWLLYEEMFKNFVLVDDPGLSIAQMSRILASARRGPLASCQRVCVIIDHLGLIGGDARLQTYDRVSKQARELKDLAKDHNVVVLCVIQPSREGSGDGGDRLYLGSARDSGVIEEVADYILAMRRPERSRSLPDDERVRFKNIVFMEWIKNRHGPPSDRETAYQVNGISLRYEQRAFMLPPSDQLSGRRRRAK